VLTFDETWTPSATDVEGHDGRGVTGIRFAGAATQQSGVSLVGGGPACAPDVHAAPIVFNGRVTAFSYGAVHAYFDIIPRVFVFGVQERVALAREHIAHLPEMLLSANGGGRGLGISVGAVKSTASRALDALEKVMEVSR
jgi:hypothetical protein